MFFNVTIQLSFYFIFKYSKIKEVHVHSLSNFPLQIFVSILTDYSFLQEILFFVFKINISSLVGS